jgi:hypothetical protein
MKQSVLDQSIVDRGVESINRHLAHGPAATLELAKEVRRVRLLLPRGEWTRLIKTGQIHFSIRAGQMLLSIGRNIAEKLNAQLVARLPMGWSVLYPLSRIAIVPLEGFIRSERITPEMTKDEAEDLLKIYLGKMSDKGPKRPNVERRFLNLVEFVCESLNVWTATERDWARRVTNTLLEQLNADPAAGQVFLAKALGHLSENGN